MALPIIPDTIRCSVEGQTAIGSLWANVLHFRKTGVITLAAAIALIEPELKKLYGPSASYAGGQRWCDPAATSWKVVQFRYTLLDGSTASVVNANSSPGQSAVEAIPAGAACVFTLRTAKRGRSYRGRVYWGGYSESSNTSASQPQTSTITGQVSAWNSLVAALSGSGVSLVVASYLHQTAEDVTTVTSQGRWESQRRRNR